VSLGGGVVLLLDVDGVLQFGRAGFQRAIESDYQWRDGYLAFQRDLFSDPEYQLTLVGRADFLTVADRLLVEHVRGLTAERFLERWTRENIEMNEDLIEALPALDVKAVYLATNQEPLRGAHIERSYSSFVWLAGSFVSHRMGCRKPSKAYFERILTDLNCSGRDVIFVDDADSCVAAAKEVGIRAVRFENNEQLLSDLATQLATIAT
jgi:putative hydrolase of the HAD superfamily